MTLVICRFFWSPGKVKSHWQFSIGGKAKTSATYGIILFQELTSCLECDMRSILDRVPICPCFVFSSATRLIQNPFIFKLIKNEKTTRTNPSGDTTEPNHPSSQIPTPLQRRCITAFQKLSCTLRRVRAVDGSDCMCDFLAR